MRKTDINNEPSPEKIMETSFGYATTRVLVTGVAPARLGIYV
jgi:hypothetical protein